MAWTEFPGVWDLTGNITELLYFNFIPFTDFNCWGRTVIYLACWTTSFLRGLFFKHGNDVSGVGNIHSLVRCLCKECHWSNDEWGGLETPDMQHIDFLNPIRPRLSTLLICLKHLYRELHWTPCFTKTQATEKESARLNERTLLCQQWHHKLHYSVTHIFNRKDHLILLKDSANIFFFFTVTLVKVNGWNPINS